MVLTPGTRFGPYEIPGEMKTSTRFSRPILSALREARILGVRAGDAGHRFTGVWVVVVDDRVFVRSWNDKPSGWHRAFLAQPAGAIHVLGRDIRVRAKRARGERLMEAIERAYAEKYQSAASQKWVRGFRLPKRRATTTEFVPGWR